MDTALISLLKDKPLEYITVRELCEKAGVNRSTFYLHYDTIGDLLEETTHYLLDDFLSYFSQDRKAIAFNIDTCSLDDLNFVRDRYLVPYLTYILNNKEVFHTALVHNKVLGFDDVYNRWYEIIFNPILERFKYSEKDRRYVMMYYLNGINAIILEWLKNGCDKSINDVAKIITVCVFGLGRSQCV